MKIIISLLSALFLSIGLFAQIVLERDINEEAASSTPQYVTELNGQIYFRADDGIHGEELHRYDPVSGNSMLVSDVRPLEEGGTPTSIFAFDGKLFMGLRGGSNFDLYLFTYDPITDSFEQIYDTNGERLENPFAFSVFAGKLYFRVTFENEGAELGCYDPATNSVKLVADINPNGNSFPNGIVNYDGKLYFGANDGTEGKLYSYDPQTEEVIHVPISNSLGQSPTVNISYVYEGRLYFKGYTQDTGDELWVYDIDSDSLMDDTEVWLGGPSSNPSGFTGYNGKVYFSAREPVMDTELRVYDPATNEISLVADLNPDGNASPNGITLLSDKLYFSVNFDGPQNLLYEYDLIAEEFTNLGGLDNGENPNYMTIGTVADNKIYVTGNILEYGYELFQYQIGGTTFELATDVNQLTIGSDPYGFTTFNNKLYFGADEINTGREVWLYNPATGTVDLLTDQPGFTSPDNFVAVGNRLYYTGSDDEFGYGLKYYNENSGTINATSYFTPNSVGGIDGVILYNDRLYFSNDIDTFGQELIAYDPMTDTYEMVADLYPGDDSRPEKYFIYNEELYFAGTHPEYGRELFKYNSNTDEITLAADINPGEEDGRPESYVLYGGEMYFVAYNGDYYEIYSYNSNTQTLTQRTISTVNSDTRYLTVYRDRIFCSAKVSNSTNVELCYLDTLAGELILAADISPGGGAGSPRFLVPFNDELYFSANTEEYGRELWVYNDTVASIFADIKPGPSGSEAEFLTLFNDKLYLAADDGLRGTELYSVAECLNILIDTEPSVDSTEVGIIDITVTGGQEPYSFSWNNGATTEDLFNVGTGIFTVTVSDVSGCISEITAEVPFVSDLEELLNPDLITVFPNPNKGKFNIESGNLNPLGLTMYDMQGRIIYRLDGQLSANTTVRMLHPFPGIYILKIELEDGIIIKKLKIE